MRSGTGIAVTHHNNHKPTVSVGLFDLSSLLKDTVPSGGNWSGYMQRLLVAVIQFNHGNVQWSTFPTGIFIAVWTSDLFLSLVYVGIIVMYSFWTNVYNGWNIELYRNVNMAFQGCCFFFRKLILRTLNVILEQNLTWILLKHSIFNVKFSIGPLGSITATEVLWHQYDRINTSKAMSGPTAASHSQCSTFHVLLRFTAISHKPTASQTEKKIMESTCRYRVFPQLQWNISNATFDERLKFNRLKRGKYVLTVSHGLHARQPLNLTFKL